MDGSMKVCELFCYFITLLPGFLGGLLASCLFASPLYCLEVFKLKVCELDGWMDGWMDGYIE